jgi:hypothetical protein
MLPKVATASTGTVPVAGVSAVVFTAHFAMEQHTLKCKQLFEQQHLLLLRDIWWSKL